jgi:hypothetical protein
MYRRKLQDGTEVYALPRLAILFETTEKRAAIAQAITLLSTCYPNGCLLPETVDLYVEALEELHPNLLANVFSTVQMERDALPTPAKMRYIAECETFDAPSEWFPNGRFWERSHL